MEFSITFVRMFFLGLSLVAPILLIAILGIMLTGIIVAITVEAASRAFEAHVALEQGAAHASP